MTTAHWTRQIPLMRSISLRGEAGRPNYEDSFPMTDVKMTVGRSGKAGQQPLLNHIQSNPTHLHLAFS